MSTLHHTRFVTAEMTNNMKRETLMTALKQVVNAYKKIGFSLTDVLADNHFECTRDGLAKNGVSSLHDTQEGTSWHAAILFLRRLTAKVFDMGFDISPYDRSEANKFMDVKQCTILWHVDDIKVSHCNPWSGECAW